MDHLPLLEPGETFATRDRPGDAYRFGDPAPRVRVWVVGPDGAPVELPGRSGVELP